MPSGEPGETPDISSQRAYTTDYTDTGSPTEGQLIHCDCAFVKAELINYVQQPVHTCGVVQSLYRHVVLHSAQDRRLLRVPPPSSRIN